MEDALQSLDVWTRSRNLAVAVYRNLASCRDRGFKDQITRAAVSVPSNIAEGFERNSKREFVRFMLIARGSCAEVRTQLYIGEEIGFIDTPIAGRLQTEALEISKMLQGLVNRYKSAKVA
jgi:four helix bundle protein